MAMKKLLRGATVTFKGRQIKDLTATYLLMLILCLIFIPDSIAMEKHEKRIMVQFQNDSQIHNDLQILMKEKGSRIIEPGLFDPAFNGNKDQIYDRIFDLFQNYHIKSIQPLLSSIFTGTNYGKTEKLYLVYLSDNIVLDQALRLLNQHAEVEFAEPDFIGYGGGKPSFSDDFGFAISSLKNTPPVNDQMFHLQYGLLNTGQTINGVAGIPGADINAVPGWEITTGDSELILAVLDSGIADSHEDFQGKVYMGYNFVSDNNNFQDDHGHGTSVASIAAAKGNNNGIIAGTDWNTRILPVKVLNQNNSGYYSWWINGIQYAIEHGAHVINMSVGGSSYSSALHNAVNEALDNNLIVVACMMNDDNDVTFYPAGFEGVFAIGATNNRDERAAPFSWGGGSNYGDHIDFVAPGNNIASLSHTDHFSAWYWSGTSMATPFVAGTITLMLSIDMSLDADAVYDILKETVRPQVAGKTNEDWNPLKGWGRLDAGAELDLTLQGVIPSNTDALFSFSDNYRFELFPNPATNKVTIAGDLNNEKPYNVEIIALNGSKVKKIILTLHENKSVFDISDLKNGIYFVRITGKDYTFARKLIVQKP